MQIPLTETIIRALKEKYIDFQGNKLEIVVKDPPGWVKEELEQFIKDFKETTKYENYWHRMYKCVHKNYDDMKKQLIRYRNKRNPSNQRSYEDFYS